MTVFSVASALILVSLHVETSAIRLPVFFFFVFKNCVCNLNWVIDYILCLHVVSTVVLLWFCILHLQWFLVSENASCSSFVCSSILI